MSLHGFRRSPATRALAIPLSFAPGLACIAMGFLGLSSVGCTSFRTTALQRFGNDSVAPESSNRRLKGLPVKLKVPSHVRVTIHEQQLILANTPEEIVAKKEAASDAAAEVKRISDQITKLSANVVSRRDARAMALREIDEAKAELSLAQASTDSNKPERIRSAETWITAAIKRHVETLQELAQATEELSALPQKQQDLERAKASAAAKADESQVTYRLVSFTPAQLVVETELEYTDKVFLVDFRRPAGGILDLKEASMDDEQYFAKVQADITERTMADVGSAINSLKGPLTARLSSNRATPTAASTPGEQQAVDVHFQKSIVAIQRFDISQPNWECRMNAFVNQRLAQTEPAAPIDAYPANATPFVPHPE